MKVYSIGREAGCDIVINDATDVISRRHAVLNVSPSGKMTIVDSSHNGTYVNGIRISPNVPVPVTRKDNISFAHVARLDWNMVPKTTSAMRYIIIGIVAVIIVVCGVFAFEYLSHSEPESPAVEDTTHVRPAEPAKPEVINQPAEKSTPAEKAAQPKKKAAKPKSADKRKKEAAPTTEKEPKKDASKPADSSADRH